MTFKKTTLLASSALALAIAMPYGCGDSDNEACVLDKETNIEMCSISGVLLNLNDASRAQNACVFLLDNEANYISNPSTAEGEYTVKVPKGSPFNLVVDDCDEPMANNMGTWYPTINADNIFVATVEKNYLGWPLHVSTNTPSAENEWVGANGAYERFFKDATSTQKDYFAPVDGLYSDNLGGFIFLGSFWEFDSETGNLDIITGQSMTISGDNDACKVGYVRNEGLYPACPTDQNDPNFEEEYFACLFPSPSVGPNILQDGGGTATDDTGAIVAFCDDTVGSTVNVALQSPTNPVKTSFSYNNIPVRNNACTVMFPASLSGAEVPIKDVLLLVELI